MAVLRGLFLAAFIVPPFAAASEFWEREILLGELGGLRSAWEMRGFSANLLYTGEYFANTRGGLATHRAREYQGLFSLELALETAAAGWWENGLFFVQLQERHGRGLSERYVGDYQVFSNIDHDRDFAQVSEVWYRHEMFDGRFWIKAGKQEANSDFAANEYGLEFLHSSPGVGPNIPLPTYPDQDWGVVFGLEEPESCGVRLGIFQGRPEGGRSPADTLDRLYGPMLLLEPWVHYHVADRPGGFHVGLWWNGDRFGRLDPDRPEPGYFGESYGAYLTLEQELHHYREACGLDLLLQLAWAPEDRSEVEYYSSLAVQWTGPWAARPADVAGVGVFRVDFSDRADFAKGSETAFEVFYKFQLCGWASLKLDAQHILDPGGGEGSDATVVGIRWEVAF